MITIVPTRGRPGNAAELIDAWNDTGTKNLLLFAIDDDELDKYEPVLKLRVTPIISYVVAPRIKMGPTLNKWAVELTEWDDTIEYVGFMGDDHRPRTPGWDQMIIDELDELGTGIVYGNDLIWGEGLPTAVFMTADIIRALGYMHPPELIHLYLDNFWLDFGTALGKITYLDNVVIEHMHPSVGKSFEDPGYQEVNAPEMYDHDRQALERYKDTQMEADLEKVRALL